VRREGFNVLIPHIDPATVALSRLKPDLKRAGVNVVVSEESLCTTMYDKSKADAFFRAHGIPVPDGEIWPKVAKPRFGSSSRGQVIFRDMEEFQFWSHRNQIEDYIVQPYVRGTEYSVDAFVGPEGKSLGAVARIRLVVSGGEVMVAKTDRNEAVLNVAEKVLAIPGWYGPVNIQVMHTSVDALLLEVNPRFSSGATLAIEAGLDSPRWIIREFLGRSLPEKPIVWRPGLFLTRCRKDYFLWSS
jgi:carbamoyl-phosphate synthase large subunit